MVEHADGGPLVLNSFIEPVSSSAAEEDVSALDVDGKVGDEAEDNGASNGEGSGGANRGGDGPEGDGGDVEDPPMFVAVVVGASAEDGREARRAAARLERVARDFQREWTAEETGETAG